MNPASWSEHLAPLVFLRPQWLWALLALPLLGAWWWRGRRRSDVWRGAVDAHLLPHLLEARQGRRSQYAIAAAAAAWLLAVLALSGPSWSQGEQPLWQGSTPMVVALDLSSRVLAADLPPSRLAQAKAKLAELLRRRAGGGQVALVVYADDAFTVAPLTDDPDNVAVFLDALAPDIMPGDGQRADRAIAWSAKLLRQGGFNRGRIVLITDRGDGAAERAAAKAAGSGYTVSVLGLGSAAGAAFQRPDGRLVKVKLDTASLRELARVGGGRYAVLSADDSDLRALDIASRGDTGGTGSGEKRLAREDDGYWLLPPLLLLALLAFRRRSGVGAIALLLCLGLPLATAPAQAQSLWQRADQSAHQRVVEGNEAYRAGQFERAGELYRRGQGADAQYNLGNALARQGRYPEAIAAYDRALKEQPGMADAIANKRAVEEAMKRPPPQNQDGQGQQPKPSSGQQKNDRSPQQQNPQQKPDGKPQRPPDQPDRNGQPQDPSKNPGADPEAQRRADQAQRERMQRELERQRAQQGKPPPGEREPARTPAQRERQQANDAWLKRVPDDPGSLLRERFKIEYARRQMSALEGD